MRTDTLSRGLALGLKNPQRTSLLKRGMDILFSVHFLLVFLPLLAILAFLVKLDSKGPVFYRQTRVGMNRRNARDRRGDARCRCAESRPGSACGRRAENLCGKQFQILKIRSMYINAEGDGRPMWCRSNDPRITRVGYVLRKTHIDEIPQLFNILAGDMSLVGPRPERPEFVARLKDVVPGYAKRLSMRPGLTGLAQIRQRADLVIDDVRRKVRYDLLYSKKMSPGTDVKILFGTLLYILSPLWKSRAKAPLERPGADVSLFSNH
ncbi:MAG: sugar transferase [Elusimicrobia bacterium]|nr:sugar transferase [Elusimicrobiota bacterium]